MKTVRRFQKTFFGHQELVVRAVSAGPGLPGGGFLVRIFTLHSKIAAIMAQARAISANEAHAGRKRVRAECRAQTRRARAAAAKRKPMSMSRIARAISSALALKTFPSASSSPSRLRTSSARPVKAAYRKCLIRQEKTQPTPKAMSRLATGLRRTCSPTSSMPLWPAS